VAALRANGTMLFAVTFLFEPWIIERRLTLGLNHRTSFQFPVETKTAPSTFYYNKKFSIVKKSWERGVGPPSAAIGVGCGAAIGVACGVWGSGGAEEQRSGGAEEHLTKNNQQTTKNKQPRTNNQEQPTTNNQQPTTKNK